MAQSMPAALARIKQQDPLAVIYPDAVERVVDDPAGGGAGATWQGTPCYRRTPAREQNRPRRLRLPTPLPRRAIRGLLLVGDFSNHHSDRRARLARV